jgi:hypothetical protein
MFAVAVIGQPGAALQSLNSISKDMPAEGTSQRAKTPD